jgi:hypothetical protein
MPRKISSRFAICLAASAEEDVQVGKVYQLVPDRRANDVGCLRLVDDSGEDYLYPATRFLIVQIPREGRERLLRAVGGK